MLEDRAPLEELVEAAALGANSPMDVRATIAPRARSSSGLDGLRTSGDVVNVWKNEDIYSNIKRIRDW